MSQIVAARDRSTGVAAVEKYLLPTEQVVILQRRHWAVLTGPTSIVLGGLLLAFALDTVLPRVPYIRDVLWLAWTGLVAFFLWHLAEWWFDRFIVTDRRIMLVTGLIVRKVAMMPLVKVTDMNYKRSVWGRFLGYGEFVMENAGQDQALRTVTFVAHPDWLYRQLCSLLFGDVASPPPPLPPPPTDGSAGGTDSPGGAGGPDGGAGGTTGTSTQTSPTIIVSSDRPFLFDDRTASDPERPIKGGGFDPSPAES